MKKYLLIFSFLFIYSCHNSNKINSIKKYKNNENKFCENYYNKVSRNCDNFNGKYNPKQNSVVQLMFNNQEYCTGFFITEHFILTAAHCVINKGNYAIKSNNNISNVVNIIINKASFNDLKFNIPYNIELGLTYIGDIAILESSKSAHELNVIVNKIFKEFVYPKEKAYSIGFGATEISSDKNLNWTTGYFSGINLKQTDLKILDNITEREKSYINSLKLDIINFEKNIPNLNIILYFFIKYPNLNSMDEMLSVVYGGINGGACLRGDSGGPVFVIRNNEHFVYSLNSFGSGVVYPTGRICIQTILKYYLNWIKYEIYQLNTEYVNEINNL